MSQPPDDTTESPAPVARERAQEGRYYYDDATGYEPYDPAQDKDDDNDDAGEQPVAPTAR